MTNPVFSRELRSAIRSGRIFVVAGLYAMALGALAIHAWPAPSQAVFGSRVGERIFSQFRWLQLVLALALAPALTWAAISGEREQRTWGTLRATPLRPYQIVSGKLLSSLAQLLLIICASLPISCYCFFLGGVSPKEIANAYASALFAGVAAGSAGLACSCWMRKTVIAIPLAYVLIACMALVLWPMRVHWQTVIFIVSFFVLAVLLCRRIGDREGGVGGGEAQDDRLELDERSIPGNENPVAGLEWNAMRRLRWKLAIVVLLMSVAIPAGLAVVLQRPHGITRALLLFTWYAPVQIGLVILLASIFGAQVIASEQERRTMPLLLSTPLSASVILAGKLRYIMGNISLIVLSSVPMLMFAGACQVVSFSEVLMLIAAQFAYGLAFAVIGLFISVRSKRASRALSAALAFLLLISLASFQVLPLVHSLAEKRSGQWLMATNPIQTVYEREKPAPWEIATAKPETPGQDKKVHRFRLWSNGSGAWAMGRPVEPGDIEPEAEAPKTWEETRWFAMLDDIPFASVLGASLVIYVALASVLWLLMRAKFRSWAMLQ